MRFITFKTLEGKNFLSFGDSVVKIDLQKGVNVITGINLDKEDSKNGVGKSSISELLYFGLYGTTIREISKDFIQNSITKKKCETALTFELTNNDKTDVYKIVRELNPTKCILFKNGEDVTRSTLAKTNIFIQELIRTPSTVFQNSVIMSANNAVPFMALSKTDKRKFVESVLGLEVFGSMVLKARDQYNTTKKEYEVQYSKYEICDKELAFNRQQLSTFTETNNIKQKDIQHKKELLQKDILTLKKKLTNKTEEKIADKELELKELLNSEKEANNNVLELQTKLIKIQTTLKSEEKNIQQHLQNKEICPTCKRQYAEEHIKQSHEIIVKHESNVKLLQDAENKTVKMLSNAKNQLKIKRDQIDSLQDEIKIIKDKSTQDQITKNSIAHFERNIIELESELIKLQNQNNKELELKILEQEEQVSTLKQSIESLNKQLSVLESVKFIISEEGIKSFLVKKIIIVLNSRLSYYLKKLDANCLCKFNEFFEESIIDENTNPKSYFNFSGGERKRIDLACLFAFADVRRMQGDVNFGTIFYDELLDSSLDDKGVMLTIKILRERFETNNESCYIITHRGPEVLVKAEHIINLVKKNGITTIQK